jgi:hypothetical protein
MYSMSSKSGSPESHEVQGALFETHEISSGVTDPALASTRVELEPVPEGFYPEKTEPVSEIVVNEDKTAKDALHQEVVSRNRHDAQVGKHSPLSRTGTYEDIQVGDYLPGFGPVTYRNFSDASKYAVDLEARRKGER